MEVNTAELSLNVENIETELKSNDNSESDNSESKPKLSKKKRRLLKNKLKLESLLTELNKVHQNAIDLQKSHNKLTLLMKTLNHNYPIEVKKIKQETELNKINLMKSGIKGKIRYDKPVTLSDDLYRFLNISNKQPLKRTEVIKQVASYIRKKKLQDPNNRNVFNIDENLSVLFKVPEGNGTIPYHQIHKYITPHLQK